MGNFEKDYLEKFHIGTYYLQSYARTRNHVQDLRDCGIDFVIGVDNEPKTLDLFRDYGIGAIVSDAVPGWFGGRGENAGTMHIINKSEMYADAAMRFCDHPAIIGIDFGDEPSSVDFPYLGEVLRLSATLFPNKLRYLNIYPSYGMLAGSDAGQVEKELGKSSYSEYLRSYGQTIDLPYLCFDHYVYSSNRERFLSDLLCAAEFCREHKRKLWIVLQVNSSKEDVFISEDQLRNQAFLALAYGVSTITWACYTAGWWYNQVLDAKGEKTEQYSKLRTVNTELRTLTTEYIKYRWVNTVDVTAESAIRYGRFERICASEQGLLGKFQAGDDQFGIFYTPLHFQSEKMNTLSFALPREARAFLYTPEGKQEVYPDSQGVYRIQLRAHWACFITLA